LLLSERRGLRRRLPLRHDRHQLAGSRDIDAVAARSYFDFLLLCPGLALLQQQFGLTLQSFMMSSAPSYSCS
ncbi:hypothetical protein LOK49_LG03G00514, partial [Camellia lanceoleosa]